MKRREFPGAETWKRPAPAWNAKDDLQFQNVTLSYITAPPHALSKVRFPASAADPKLPTIVMYGLAKFDRRNGVEHGGFPVCVRVHGFLPYFLTRIEDPALLAEIARGGAECAKAREAKRAVYELLSHSTTVMRVDLVHRKDIMGWTPEKTWFWKITVALPNSVGALRKMIHRVPPADATDDEKAKFDPSDGLLYEDCFGRCTVTYESNVPFAVRYMDDKNVPGMGWAVLPGGKYEVTPEGSKTTTTHLEVDVHYEEVRPMPFDHPENAPLRVLSLDIECMGRGKAFPVPERDPIGCICVKCWEKQPDGMWKEIRGAAFTWKKPAPSEKQMKDDLIVCAKNEHEMHLYFSKFIRLFDPDICTGHNCVNFDWWYIIHRAKALRIEEYDPSWENFFNLGRNSTPGGRSRIEVKKMTAAGLGGTVEYKFTIMDGRNPEYDNLILRMRNVAEKYRSYTLEDIGQDVLGEGKIDMPYYRITPMLNGPPDEVWKVIEYCLRDAKMPFEIMMRKNDIENHVEMARLTLIPFRMLIANGQQVRYQSLLLNEVHPDEVFVLPYCQPPEKKKKKTDAKDYEGATVLDPKIDYYICKDLPSEKSERKRLERGAPELGTTPGGSKNDQAKHDAKHEEEEEEEERPKKKKKKQKKKKKKRQREESEEEEEKPQKKPKVVHGKSFERDQNKAEERMREELYPEYARKKTMNRPVATLDFASLYPSIMLHKNLCYTTWIKPHMLEEARRRGIPMERMSNGEWFIDPWDLIVPREGETVADACARLRAGGAKVELKNVRHYVEKEEVARLREEGKAVREVREETEWKKFRGAGKLVTRWYWTEEVWKVRNEERVGVLPKILEKLLGARKGAKGAMGAAQKKVKALKDVLGLALLLTGDDTHETNERAMWLLADRGTKELLKRFGSFAGARKNSDLMAALLERMIGKKETKKNWKRVLLRLGEYFLAAIAKLPEIFTEDAIAVCVKAGGAKRVLDNEEWFAERIMYWTAQEAANDARQMALKVVCNSVYGATGATVGKLPCLAVSSAVTATGRDMILQCKEIAEQYDPATGLYGHGTSPYQTEVVYGDTDSIFVAIHGCPTIKEAFKIAGAIAKKCTESFYSGHVKLELEKIFKRLLLMSKKRYWGVKVEYNKNGDLVESEYNRGTEKVRRDNAPIVRNTLTKCMDIISYEDDLEKAIEVVRDTVRRMQAGTIPMDEYIISKAVTKDLDEYDGAQAHIELLKRMAKRTENFVIEKGMRVPFVFTAGGKKAKAVDMAEDPEYVKERNLPINWQYYVTNQLVKPVCRFLGPLLSNAEVTKKERLERAEALVFNSGGTAFVRIVAAARDESMAKFLGLDRKREAEEEEEEEEHAPAPKRPRVAQAPQKPLQQSTLTNFFSQQK